MSETTKTCQEEVIGHCKVCETPLYKSDKWCPTCGEMLVESEEE